MTFTQLSAPKDDPFDDDTYSHPQGEVPGVSALAGQDPIDDVRRENAALRAALLTTLVQLRSTASTNSLLASRISELLGGA